MITLVAGGDSHIWGSELRDCPHGGAGGYSRKTFTALLNYDNYICAAYPGIGNYEIVHRVKDKLDTSCVVFICWSWPTRDKISTSSKIIQDFQEYCEYNQIPYLFTCVDNCLIELLDSKTNFENWFMFPPGTESYHTQQPRGFYQWAVENKYSVGPEGHPLEDAHYDAAELIKEKFNELVKKSV